MSYATVPFEDGVNYRAGVPYLGDVPLASLSRHVAEHAARTPDRVAVVQRAGAGWRNTTYAELSAAADVFAAALPPAARGRLLPMYVAKSAESVAAMIGALRAGVPFSCLNRKLRPAQIEAVLQAAGATECLIDASGIMSLRRSFIDGWSGVDITWRLLEVPGDPLSAAAQNVIAQLPAERRPRPLPAPGHVHDDVDEADPGRAGAVLFTSGSTGVPKGVVIGEHDLRARAAAEVEWFGLQPDDVLLSILPFSFDVGLNQLCTALSIGASLVLIDSWLSSDILTAVAARRVTGISAVPAIWQDMINGGFAFDVQDAHASLRYITISGGDMPLALLERVPQIAPGVRIFKTYGQTEAFRATSLRPDEFAGRTRSVGRAFRGVELRVLREDGSVCAPGEVGEVVHGGLGVMLGYLNGGDTASKLKEPPPLSGMRGPVIFTGDHAVMDEDGYLFLKGRSDGMLKVANNRVYPLEVIAQVMQLPGVADAHVTGVRDPQDGETRLVAFAVGTGLDPDRMRRDLAQMLPSYMVPHHVVLLDAMPRTENGKPDQKALALRAAELVPVTKAPL